MFTGLISELAEVKALKNTGNSYELTIKAHTTLQDLKIGDSVAVNGVCLTVTAFDTAGFTVQVMPETTQNTIIALYKSGTKVNLERTLRVSDRLDGHIVSGHVDSVGTIIYKKSDEIAWRIGISVPTATTRYIIHKGSVAIDGISLTVTKVTDSEFEVSIIPHTLQNTTLGHKGLGAKVNIETDVLGKYVEKLLTGSTKTTSPKGVSMTTLAENGFV